MQIDQLILSDRKSICLTIENDGSLVVRAPKRLPEREIRKFVNLHTDWVLKRRTYLNSHPHPEKHLFESGERFFFLGVPVRLEIDEQNASRLSLRYIPGENGSMASFVLPKSTQTQRCEVMIHWYKKQARKVCTDRVETLARKYGFSFKRIRISSARTRWGSCSSKGTLSFTYRLVTLPPEIIDYVVLHELVHTVEPNHSKQFWGEVERLMPDYKQHRSFLKKKGAIFSF